MQRLEVLGWWFNDAAPNGYPRPQRLVAPWEPAARAAVVRHLRAGRTLTTYPEASFCRFACADVDMGRADLTDGRFVWPDGLVHYVECHSVRLPEPFVAHAVAGAALPAAIPKPRFGLFDTGPWLTWARAQGACLDLDGWQLPDPDTRERIGAELHAIEHTAILLCRGDTRQVVLRHADGSFAVHQLRAGGHAPRPFTDWDAWPIDGHGSGRTAGDPAPAAGRRMASDDVFAALRRKFSRGEPPS